MIRTERYFAIIPAAGSGQRMSSQIPKQYLALHGKPIISYAVNIMLNAGCFEKIIVPINDNDLHWEQLGFQNHRKICPIIGGEERSHSVLNALQALSHEADDNDWILVHDAVRPCLQLSDLNKLIEAVTDHKVGGLLGIPVRDTIKRVAEDSQVAATIDRSQLWCAYSPQMFRYGVLYKALQTVIANNFTVTDEASALEYIGERPKMVRGRFDNIKVTFAEDLFYAEQLLEPISSKFIPTEK